MITCHFITVENLFSVKQDNNISIIHVGSIFSLHISFRTCRTFFFLKSDSMCPSGHMNGFFGENILISHNCSSQMRIIHKIRLALAYNKCCYRSFALIFIRIIKTLCSPNFPSIFVGAQLVIFPLMHKLYSQIILNGFIFAKTFFLHILIYISINFIKFSRRTCTRVLHMCFTIQISLYITKPILWFNFK